MFFFHIQHHIKFFSTILLQLFSEALGRFPMKLKWFWMSYINPLNENILYVLYTFPPHFLQTQQLGNYWVSTGSEEKSYGFEQGSAADPESVATDSAGARVNWVKRQIDMECFCQTEPWADCITTCTLGREPVRFVKITELCESVIILHLRFWFSL